MFTSSDAGTWLLTDQTSAGSLTLRTIALMLPFEQLFKGIADDGERRSGAL